MHSFKEMNTALMDSDDENVPEIRQNRPTLNMRKPSQIDQVNVDSDDDLSAGCHESDEEPEVKPNVKIVHKKGSGIMPPPRLKGQPSTTPKFHSSPGAEAKNRSKTIQNGIHDDGKFSFNDKFVDQSLEKDKVKAKVNEPIIKYEENTASFGFGALPKVNSMIKNTQLEDATKPDMQSAQAVNEIDILESANPLDWQDTSSVVQNDNNMMTARNVENPLLDLDFDTPAVITTPRVGSELTFDSLHNPYEQPQMQTIDFTNSNVFKSSPARRSTYVRRSVDMKRMRSKFTNPFVMSKKTVNIEDYRYSLKGDMQLLESMDHKSGATLDPKFIKKHSNLDIKDLENIESNSLKIPDQENQNHNGNKFGVNDISE
jgi:hypothetical protein